MTRSNPTFSHSSLLVSFAALFGVLLSACSGMVPGSAGTGSGNFSVAGTGPTEGAAPAAAGEEKGTGDAGFKDGPMVDATSDRSSMPGGMVATEYDPHNDEISEAQAFRRVTATEEEGIVRVELSGRITKLVGDKERPSHIRIFNSRPWLGRRIQVLDVALSEDLRFETSFKAQKPVDLDYVAFKATSDIETYNSMASCELIGCWAEVREAEDRGGELIVTYLSPVILPSQDGISRTSLEGPSWIPTFEAPAPAAPSLEGSAVWTVSPTAAKGIIRVDLTGRMTAPALDEERPTHVRIFNADASGVPVELEDVRLTEDLQFQATFLAHALANPLKLIFYAFKTTSGISLYHDFPAVSSGAVPALIACSTGNCEQELLQMERFGGKILQETPSTPPSP